MKREKRIFALGFFDGVHLGHQALLSRCVELAGELEAEPSAITFDRHPQALFREDVPALINTTEDRQRLLKSFGMETVRVYPVVREVMSMPWQLFVTELIALGAVGFVCGNDFRFGAGGQGNAENLLAFCRRQNIPCIIVPEQTAQGIRISSTHIRTLLENGEMDAAMAFLGHPHMFTGTVVPGRHLGRTIGVPTANLRLPPEVLVPKFGVYACLAVVDGKKYPAVTNIGTRPTVGGHHVTVEPWILDFSGNLYDRELTLQFYQFLRPEKKFDSLEELKQEISKNAAQTRAIFAETDY